MLRSLIVICLLLMSACFPFKRGKKAAEPRIEYGMTREAVLARIKDRHELLVGEFNLPRGQLVAYQYSLYGKPGLKEPKYILYFMNDTLIRKSDPEDLQQGARKAVREYYDPKPAAPSRKR